MKNYEVLHYINDQVISSGYGNNLSQALQELFTFMDNQKEEQGCVIGSIVASLILKCFKVEHTLHLGELGYWRKDANDEMIDAYHCWITVDDKILDLAIYASSHYNPYFLGKPMDYPIVFESKTPFIYQDGSTESNSWLADLSEKSYTDYLEHCPVNLAVKMAIRCLGSSYDMKGQNAVYQLAKDMYFPKLQHTDASPSGRGGLEVDKKMKYAYIAKQAKS